MCGPFAILSVCLASNELKHWEVVAHSGVPASPSHKMAGAIYSYRALDKEGNTIEFMLGAKRDNSAAKRFFKKMMRADHRRLPFSISVDKHASYPDAFAASQEEKVLPSYRRLRRTKYLTNIVE